MDLPKASTMMHAADLRVRQWLQTRFGARVQTRELAEWEVSRTLDRQERRLRGLPMATELEMQQTEALK